MNANSFALIVTILAALLVFVGAAAQHDCGIFLPSSDARAIRGAGLGFVGGAVLLGSGTIAQAMMSRRAAPPLPPAQ